MVASAYQRPGDLPYCRLNRLVMPAEGSLHVATALCYSLRCRERVSKLFSPRTSSSLHVAMRYTSGSLLRVLPRLLILIQETSGSYLSLWTNLISNCGRGLKKECAARSPEESTDWGCSVITPTVHRLQSAMEIPTGWRLSQPGGQVPVAPLKSIPDTRDYRLTPPPPHLS